MARIEYPKDDLKANTDAGRWLEIEDRLLEAPNYAAFRRAVIQALGELHFRMEVASTVPPKRDE